MKSLEDLIGAMLVIGVPGTKVTPEIVQHFKDTHAGGIIFYRINFESPDQIKKFISDLETALGRKLLVCVDHEGGRVIMYRDGVSIFPDNLTFGHMGDPVFAEQAGTIAAAELRALGTDINFAPCLDVLTDSYSPNIGIRAFGKDWKLVSDMGVAYLTGLQKGGVSATVKHFPGKGHAHVDAHLKLPTINSTWEDMKKIHLKPFVASLAAGVDCVMTSHPFYPNLDPNNIATFSRRIVYQTLRKELGFKGLIVSDDLEMGAVKDVSGIGAAAVKTVAAGHDLVLSCHDMPSQKMVFNALLKAYQSDLLSKPELEASVDRIEKIKAKRTNRFEGKIGPVKGGAELALFVSRKGLRILQDPKKRIPLKKTDWKDTLVIFPKLSAFASKIMVEQDFEDEKKYLSSRAKDAGLEIYPIDPDKESIKRIAAAAGKNKHTVFFSYDAHLHPEELSLLKAVQAATPNLIVVLLRDPYDMEFLRPNDSCLTAYGWRRCQIDAVFDRLHG